MVKERMPNGAPPGRPPARGVVFVHSCPRALCTHVEWAVAGVLRHALPTVTWTPQQVAPGSVRTEFPWTGEPGTASRLASTLRGWPHLRVEITEEPTPGCEGERYALTPSLGIFRAVVGVNGDIQVPGGAAARRAGARRARRGDGGAGGRRPRRQPGRRDPPAAGPTLGRRARAVPHRRGGHPRPLAAPRRLSRVADPLGSPAQLAELGWNRPLPPQFGHLMSIVALRGS